MNNHFRRLLLGTCLVILGTIGSTLFAQQSSQPAQSASSAVAASPSSRQGAQRATTVAYSADEVSVTTQTLADGNKITRRYLTKVYRDSQGRSRYESYGNHVESVGPDDSPFSINIFDPVAGVSYFLSPGDHTAQRNEVRKPRPSPVPARAGASANTAPTPPAVPQPIREDLGTQMIEGLEANGQRITRTIPAGAEGNDQPIQVTTETWIAAMGHIVLLRISNDPRRGETETRLTNLVLEEPPAELFQVPADYTIQELQPVAKPEPPSD